jgi:hypothetical protein
LIGDAASGFRSKRASTKIAGAELFLFLFLLIFLNSPLLEEEEETMETRFFGRPLRKAGQPRQQIT